MSRPRPLWLLTVFGAAVLGCGLGLLWRSDPAPASSTVLLRQVRPWVYLVESRDARGAEQSLGSAVRLQGGLTATSWHVVRGAASIMLRQNGHQWPAHVVRVDAGNDLCLLEGPVAGEDGALVGGVADAGEPVFAVGAPEGLEMVMSQGLAAGVQTIAGKPLLIASLASSAGSSGSGLFDRRGRLVGMIADQVSNGEDLTLAVPANVIARLLARRGNSETP
jgi:S1-C subfamily serine protease